MREVDDGTICTKMSNHNHTDLPGGLRMHLRSKLPSVYRLYTDIGLRLVLSLSKRNRALGGYRTVQPSTFNLQHLVVASQFDADLMIFIFSPEYPNTPPEYKMNAASLYPLKSNG